MKLRLKIQLRQVRIMAEAEIISLSKASTEPDSSFISNTPSSITQESASTQDVDLLIRRKPASHRSPIHLYTRPPFKDKPRYISKNLLYYCRLCPHTNPFRARNTTNFQLHLKKVHEKFVDLNATQAKREAVVQLQMLYNQVVTLGIQLKDFERVILDHILNKELTQQALVNLII